MVVVFLAEGFEEVEALAPVDIMRRAGLEVKLAGVTGREVTGSHGICVKADLAAEDVDVSALEAVVLPGGLPGTHNLEASPAVQACVTAVWSGASWCLLSARRPPSWPTRGYWLEETPQPFPIFNRI